MKKIYPLLFLSLLLKAVTAQHSINDNFIKTQVNNADYIFEGKIIDANHYIYHRTSKIYNSGDVYSLIVVKPTIALKGVSDTSQVFQFLIRRAYYNVSEFDTIVTSEHHIPNIPTRGIFFLKKSIKPDFIEKIFEKAMFAEFSYGASYNTKRKEEWLQYLETTFNLKPIILEKNIPEKKSANENEKQENQRITIDTTGNWQNYQQNINNYKSFLENLQIKIDGNQIPVNAKSSAADCQDLFISEYVDGSFHNKAIEIFNPTGNPINLIDYVIKVYYNGASTPIVVPLNGIIQPKETFVVAHPQANSGIIAKSDMTNQNLNFNGDDAVSLYKISTQSELDIVGVIGVNPGNSGWYVPNNGSTKERTLIRKQPVKKGQPDWVQAMNEWKVLPKDYIQNLKKHQNKCMLAEAITFTIANVIETGTTPRYLEFDIMVSGNSNSKYFDNALFRIAYNTASFGSNVVANNKVTITKGATFNSVTYTNPNTDKIDQTPSVIGVPFGTDFNQTSWNRTLVTTTPTQLLHFKIEIANCNTNPNVNFTDVGFTPMFSFYALTATANIVDTYNYDNTFYSGSATHILCKPVITNFTSPVYPGAYYPGNPTNKALLTIQGINFGATRGNGNVYFKNADDGGQTYIKLNAFDFISWADNEIKITVPSIIDSLYLPKTPTPGSGIFYVKTNTGDSVLSNTPISMPYAISNVIKSGSFDKLRQNLAEVNDSGGYTFRLDTSITYHPNPMLVPTIKKAIKEWVCATGVNFIVGEDTTINTIAQDGVSLILLTNTPPAQSALALTRTYSVQCADLNVTQILNVIKEIDIAILRDPAPYFGGNTWHFDTLYNALPANKVDFFEVILHELGHADVLNHVTQNELMNYQALLGPVAGNLRRYITFDDQDGGINVVDRSALLQYNPSCNVDGSMIIVSSPCTFGNSISENNPNVQNFQLYPNPVISDELNIVFDLLKEANVTFRIIDNTGKIIISTNEKKTAGEHTQKVSINQLSTGIYFFLVDFDGGATQTGKLVKVK